MRAMILAAGRGKRMGVLTEHTPKPLLKVNGRYLIEYSLNALVKMNIREIVINISYLGEQIKSALGDGSRYGVAITYSEEKEALETGGGVFQALPLLGPESFIVLSCDIITGYPLQKLPQKPDGLAHLVLVDNPVFHPKGDFCLEGNKIYCALQNQFSFGNIGIYKPELFADCQPGKFRLGDLLKQAVSRSEVTGEYFQGLWHNIGTPEDLHGVALSSIS